MNKFINQSNKILGFALILLLLQGCGSTSRSGTSAHQQTQASQQSLEYLLKQIQQADASKKNPLLVQAAGILVLEQRYEKAQELLIRVDQQRISGLQLDDFRLYYGETLLGLEAFDASLNQLKSISSPSAKPIHWQLRYNRSLSDSYLANSNYFEAARLRVELDDMITAAELITENNEKIWFALSQMDTSFLQKLITGFNSQRMNGWLEIVYLNKQWGFHPQKLLSELDNWKKRYPLHPALINQPERLQKAASAKAIQPRRIAVLLPLSGKNAKAGEIIYNGILAAHYQSKSAEEAPQLFFLDTAESLSISTSYHKALAQEADFIIGPLTKKAVETLLGQEKIKVPMLALNQLSIGEYSHPDVFQFGLPVEDEAVQVAHRAFEKGFRKAIAFLPDNSTGERAEKAFKDYFEQLGGELIQIQKYKDAKSLKHNVQHLLGVDSSMRRKRSLQQLLGRNLEFEARRRQDADFIFMVASPEFGHSIKPFINYYYAHDLPVLATSSVFSGKRDQQKDIDLNGIEFPDIPLLLSTKAEFQQSRKFLQTVLPEALSARGRLFALGYDSYKIISQLPILRAFPDYRWNGLSGELSVDKQGFVHRYFTWAIFNRGLPHVTKEREVKSFSENAAASAQMSSDSAL